MFTAQVISGKGRGRGIGFPTLNLEIPEHFSEKEGIYACTIVIAETTYKGALHFGPIPVFGDLKNSLEVFVLDWDGTEPPEHVSFELLKYLRPIRNFASPEALATQIAQDVENVRMSA